MANCLNCGAVLHGKYCSACGQKASVERFTFPVVLEELLHFFTHFEKGFLHTVWSFLIRPGRTALNFLAGKRKQYQPAVSYLFICTGLYILLHNYIITHYNYHLSASILKKMNVNEQANVLLRTHFTPFILAALIVNALVIYLIMARPKFNLAEIIILSLYGGGTYIAMLFVSDAILGLVFKINVISPGVFLWQTSLSSVYNFWTCFDFFSKVKMHLFWLKLFATAILVAIIGLTIFVYLPLVWIDITGHY